LDSATPAATVESAAGGKNNRSVRRRNVLFFLLDTGTFFFASSLVDMSSVMTSLMSHLTTQPVFIGFIGSAQTACWLLPQLLVARVVAGRRRKLPIVILGTGLSRLSWLFLLAALVFPNVAGPDLTLVAAYLSIGLFFFLDGVAVLAWYDLIGRTVPSNVRGRMFGMMSLSGVFALAGGLVVRAVIGSAAFPFPSDYRLLVVLALIGFAIGIVPLWLVDEPEGASVPPPEPFGDYIRRLPLLLRDRPRFRRLVELQLLLGASALAVPFYAPFAVRNLGLPEADVGIFVVGTTLGSMAGGLAFGFLLDHGRKDLAVRAVAVFALVAPLLALALAFGRPPLLPVGYRTVVMSVAMFAVGCSTRSSWMVYANYVMDIASEPERPVLIGLMNTLSGSLAVMPPLGGLLAGLFGFEATFAFATIPAAAGFVLSLGLPVSAKARQPE
jgi:MFS family permease